MFWRTMKGKKGKPIPSEVRAQVMAALLTGQGVCEVARSFQLPDSTVSRIKKTIDPKQLADVGRQLEEKKRFDFQARMLEFLDDNLKTLQAIAKEAARPEYIQKQPASELAVLYGVIADKSFRIAGALEPAEPSAH